MATLKVEPGPPGMLRVALQHFSEADLGQIKQIPGRRWDAERKQWLVPDTAEARAVLAGIVARPSEAPVEEIAVASKSGRGPARKPRATRVPGKPLTTNPPHPLIKTVDDELVLRGMAYGTRKSYGQHLRNYFDWLRNKQVQAERVTRDDVRGYLVQMASSGEASAGYCRQARAALVFLYEVVLRQPGKVSELPRMKRPQQLPVVLSREEVARLLKVITNLKHRALLMVAYSAGLRVGEVVRLKVSDIDSKRMQIRVTAGKGAKDRYTLLSERALNVLA